AAPTPQEKDARAIRDRLERADRIWRGSQLVPSTLAAVYLRARGIGYLIDGADLRFRMDCSHPTGTRQPALIAAVRDVGGRLVGIHRTYLRRDGSGKAEIEPTKASLGPVSGGAVRLASLDQVLAAGELVFAEGIETAASAGLMLNLPAWAAL